MPMRWMLNDNRMLMFGLLLSMMFHGLLMHAGKLTLIFQQKHPVEIDISNMGGVRSALQPKRRAAAAAPKPVAKPKEWLKPPPNQKAIPAPPPTQLVPQQSESTPPPPVEPPVGEYGIGTGEGSATQLSRLPQLLNLSELGDILNRFYPEQARIDLRESTVVLDLHIDLEGHVSSADIVKSGGVEFDAAAQRAVKLLRFNPAFLGSQRVAVKMRQAIEFKLK